MSRDYLIHHLMVSVRKQIKPQNKGVCLMPCIVLPAHQCCSPLSWETRMLLSCLIASVSLTYFPHRSLSLCSRQQPLTDSTFLMWARPCGGGGWRWSPFPFCPPSKSTGGETSCRAGPRVASCSAPTSSKHAHLVVTFSTFVFIPPGCSPHPATFPHILPAVWRRCRLLKQDISYIIKAPLSVPVCRGVNDTFSTLQSRTIEFKMWGILLVLSWCRE